MHIKTTTINQLTPMPPVTGRAAASAKARRTSLGRCSMPLERQGRRVEDGEYGALGKVDIHQTIIYRR